MTTLLVMTVGQTDVQLVVNNQRRKLDGNICGTLHDAIKDHSWSVVDAPSTRSRDLIKSLPEGELKLCTPKLDAVLAHFGDAPTAAIIFETNRQDARDPRMAGEVMERRLRDRGISQVIRVAYLTDMEQLESPSNEFDAVVRRTVVAALTDAIRKQVEQLTKNDKVFVATTGGLAAANELIIELVRLHAVGGPTVTSLEVPDGERAQQDDHAVEEKFHPAAGYRARWHALSLVEKGNLLGAWGAVSHLQDEPGQEWTKIIKWLACFASSLPLPADCEFDVLNHKRMGVRTALRVELALRAEDIPRAVHGTSAFLESALWDRVLECFERTGEKRKGLDILRLKAEAQPPKGDKLLQDVHADDSENRSRPFQCLEDGTYVFYENGAGRFSRYYVKSGPLKALVDAVEKVRPLRNDVAHNEPTPSLMNDARRKMIDALLWSEDNRFLRQPLVKDVLEELGVKCPEDICVNLIADVRACLLDIP
ncbi:MAG: hypothetical protein U1D30_10095 [Planctomycetota bacterium]